MPIYNLNNGPLFVFYNQKTTDQIDFLLFKKLKKEYALKLKEDKTVQNALLYSFNWCCQQMLEILVGQTEVRFFQVIFLLHEFSCPYTVKQPGESPVSQIGNQEFGVYRRVLKLCLEQACDLSLTNKNHFTFDYIELIEPILSDLIYLGSLAYLFSGFLTEEKLIPGSFILSLDKDKYNFERSENSTLVNMQMLTYLKKYKTDAYDKECVADFVDAVKSCFNVDFDKVAATIALVQDHYKDFGGRILLIKWHIYPHILKEVFKMPFENAVILLKGLTLSKANKLPLQEAISHSESLNRYLYRPILILNVNDEDFALLGPEAFDQSILSLCVNAFGWRKYPIEWKNGCFEKYIETTAQKNDKVLENAIEEVIKKNKILYDRNIINLKKWNNRNLNISSNPGEIDFIFVYQNKLFIAESKNQIMRFDINSFKHDHTYFKKTYNKKLSKKIEFLKANLAEVREHFQVLQKDSTFKIDLISVEGIFIVNTPTFTMFNNEYPIFGLPQFERYLNTDLPIGKMIEISLDLSTYF